MPMMPVVLLRFYAMGGYMHTIFIYLISHNL
jgi:hypothetical protein